jgi:hypothetical protein
MDTWRGESMLIENESDRVAAALLGLTDAVALRIEKSKSACPGYVTHYFLT